MATLIFLLLTLAFAAGGGYLLNLYALSWWLALWPLVLLAGAAVTFVLFLVFMFFHGRLIRKPNPHNMTNHRIINSILRLVLKLLNVKLVVTGKENIPEPGKAFVFVCNHQENYDIIAIKPVFHQHPLNFIAKQTIFDWPILGRLVWGVGNVPINREADRSAAISIVNGVKLIKAGVPMAIFPEGKRSFSNTMIDFKPGAFKLAMKPKADILIGTIYNFSMVFKGWPFKRQKIYLHIHPMMPAETYEKMNSTELSNHVKAKIQAQLDHYEQTA